MSEAVLGSQGRPQAKGKHQVASAAKAGCVESASLTWPPGRSFLHQMFAECESFAQEVLMLPYPD